MIKVYLFQQLIKSGRKNDFIVYEVWVGQVPVIFTAASAEWFFKQLYDEVGFTILLVRKKSSLLRLDGT